MIFKRKFFKLEDNSISIKINGKHYDEMSIVFKDLLAMNITYVSYILISSDNTIYRFSTDEKWLYNIFLEKNLILHCPLRKIVYSGLSRIISWSSLTLNKMESLVMSSRYDHNHKNGMTFSNNLNIFQGFKEVIAIATNRNDLFIENDYFLNIIKYK